MLKRSLHMMLRAAFGIMMLYVLSGCTLSMEPIANRGILDIDKIDLSDKTVKLQGEWEFYWKQLLAPDDFRAEPPPQNPHLISLPRSWNGYVWEGEKLPGDGYATFRLNLRFDEQQIGQSLALRVPTVFHSYKLWIDGVLSAEVGEVGTDRSSTIPSLATRLVHFQPQSDRVEIVLQVANFHHARGGITKHIELGDGDRLTMKTNLKAALEMFVTASLFIIGVYHLLLYLHRRKDKAPLYFGLFSMLWSFRTLLVGELIITRLFPYFPWGLQIKIEYVVLYGGTFMFTMYFYHLFKEESPAWFPVTSGIPAALFSLLVIAFPAKVYTNTLIAYEIIIVFHLILIVYILVRAALGRKESAVVFLVVTFLAFIAIINDFLYYNGWLLIGSSSTIGLFIFTSAQIYVLSSRFAKASANEEKAVRQLAAINQELLHMNQNLEHIVSERTSELSAANERLREAYDRLLLSEEGRKKLLSYITHDLKAPISTMLGYVEAVQDNVKPEKNSIYLKYVYEKTVWLNRMIEDLSFLSHLETSQIPFTMRAVSIEEVLRDFWQTYEPVIQDAELRGELRLNEPSSEDPARAWQVWADPLRIEQALSNLLSNALKFTPQGGTISLSLVYREIEGAPHAVIGLADTGVGIPPERLGRIFERNVRHYPHDFAEKSVGSGLGLAISKEIVETHRGSIWAESTGRDGSTFYIALPVMTEHNFMEGEHLEAK